MHKQVSTDEQILMADEWGQIEVTCPDCGETMIVEPDAEHGFCERCDLLVTPEDSLKKKGLV